MLYRFELEISDVDRGVYESLTFRMAQHPSETPVYLLSRLLAYALNYQTNIEFPAGGLSHPAHPAVWVPGLHGAIDLWIDVGNPSAGRLHKASKAAKQVKVYTYKRASILRDQVDPEQVHRAAEIDLFEIEPEFLARLETGLDKSNQWSLLHQQGRVDITTGSESFAGELKPFSLI